MPIRVSEGRRAISEEARPSAREEAFPSCRPTATRALALFKSVTIRVLRFIRVLFLPMIIASMVSRKTHLAKHDLPELAFEVR